MTSWFTPPDDDRANRLPASVRRRDGRPIPPRAGYRGDAAPGGLIVRSMTTLSPFLIWRSASGETRASNESPEVLILILPSRSTSVTVPYMVCRTPSGTAVAVGPVAAC